LRLADIRRWLTEAPPGTLVPAHELLGMLDEESGSGVDIVPVMAGETVPTGWRERLWIVPPDTRLGVREVAEATGRSRNWVYRHTARGGSGARLPHRRLDGALVFTAGEVRTWLSETERIVEPYRRRGLRVARP
jgi:predicted DNA-binding transcriptional regulator AlpA